MSWLRYIYTIPRGIVSILFIGLWLIIPPLIFMTMSIFTRQEKHVVFFVKYIFSMPILLLSGVRVETRGLENLKKGGGLLLFNHTSNYDIFAVFNGLPVKVNFGAKSELFKVPFFSQGMKVYGILPIERGDRNKVAKVYKKAEERMTQGEFFALAPEGGRVRSREMGPFKKGPFHFVIGAQSAAIPLVIAGAYDIMPPKAPLPNWRKLRSKIIIQLLPPVPTKGLKSEDINDFKEKIRNQMVPVYEALKEELKAEQG